MEKLINAITYKFNEKEMFYKIWKAENKSDEVINKLFELLEKNRPFYNLEVLCQQYEGGGVKQDIFNNGIKINKNDLSFDVREYPSMAYLDYTGFRNIENEKSFNKGIYKIC